MQVDGFDIKYIKHTYNTTKVDLNWMISSL